MKPIGPLIREHRRIERMIRLLSGEIEKIRAGNAVDVIFIETGVDFMRTYADRTHHGKEEDILFRELKQKNLLQEHKTTMEELIEEHKAGRIMVSKLLAAGESVTRDSSGSIEEVLSRLEDLVEFYPKHIEKEDKHFFFPILEYFTDDEQQNMLKEFDEFDKLLIHEKYENVVQRWEKEKA